MSFEVMSRRSGRRLSWTRVLGLVLVPLTVAGVLLWGLWNPQDRLETVTAAVVNLDEPVELDGQTVPLGRLLAGELIGDASDSSDDADDDATQNFDWVLTDEDDAAAGLDDGRYATVVTIPENFSAAATSLSGDPSDARKATIDIAESKNGRLIDSALSNIVTSTATSLLNQQLGEQFVGGVFVGMNELGEGIGEAADGATQLADGGTQLADGATQLADGTAQLADGTQQLASGAGALSSGASTLAGGVGQYTAGAQQLADAYVPLGQGATAAVTQLKTMIGALGGLQAESVAPQAEVQSGLEQIGGALYASTPGTLPDALMAIVTECYASGAAPEYCATLAASLGGYAGSIGGGLAQVGSGMAGLQTAQANMEAKLQAGGSGSAEGDPIAQLDALIGGLGQFGEGLTALSSQGGALASGASQLADGASQLSTGTSELAASTPQLAEGATQLADGATQAATGAGTLASGLEEAAAGIPRYSSDEREQLAQTALAPVETKGTSDALFNSSGVPLFAGIALWAGALALALLMAPLWSRTRDAARGVGWITLRSARPVVLLGALQGALAGIILPLALSYDFGQGLRFFGVAVLAGVAFALVVQGLSALLGGFGRFIAFALLVVAFATGIVSTAPAALTAIGDASPVGAVLSGFQSIANGASVGGTALLIALWGLGGLALTALAVVRARRAR